MAGLRLPPNWIHYLVGSAFRLAEKRCKSAAIPSQIRLGTRVAFVPMNQGTPQQSAPAKRHDSRLRCRVAWCWLVWLVQTFMLASSVAAEPIASGQDARASAAGTLQLLLAQETAGINGRVEIVVGELDPRISLAACSRMEPFLPKGVRAWGKVNVGIRCREGATWTVFIPVTVRVFGTALVARKTLMFGTLPAENDIEPAEAELSREAGTPVADLAQVEGKTLARSVFAGQILRQEYFRSPPAVAQGDQVKIVASGPGFSISVDGEALSHAQTGQNVRVKTDSGRVVSGIARSGRIVELHF